MLMEATLINLSLRLTASGCDCPKVGVFNDFCVIGGQTERFFIIPRKVCEAVTSKFPALVKILDIFELFGWIDKLVIWPSTLLGPKKDTVLISISLGIRNPFSTLFRPECDKVMIDANFGVMIWH